jgi:Na+/melibiose symporter-like transporter
MQILHAPALAVMPALYAKYGKVSVAVIGAILAATRILDAVIDPLIGYWSDRTRSRFGRRRPWIAAGAVVSAVSAYFFFRPSSNTGALYFLLWSAMLYIGWTLVEIPHTAWMNDVTNDYDDRSRLVTYRYLAGLTGNALFLGLPLLPIFPTTTMTPAVTALTAWIVAALLPFCVALMFFQVPAGPHSAPANGSWRSIWRELRDNRPLWLYLLMKGTNGLAMGMVAALYFFFLDNYLGLLNRYSHLNLAALLASFIGSAVWLAAMYRIGKHRALALSTAMIIATLIAFALIPRGPGAFPIALAVWIVSSLCVTGVETAANALLADVIDYGTLKSGESRAGNYWAIQAFMQKVTLAAGGGLALIIVGLFGFNPGGGNTYFALQGFFIAFIWIPIGLNIVASVLAWHFPLDRRRHAIIRRRLDAREARLLVARAAA